MATNRIRNLITGLASGIIGSLLVLFLHWISPLADLFYDFEAATYDWRMRRTIEPPPNPIEDIVIVDIDGRTLEAMGSLYQWPRSEWAHLIDVLRLGETKTIGLDILFDPSKRFPAEDARFVEAVANHGKVVSAITLAQSDAANFTYAMQSEPEGFDSDRLKLTIPPALAERLPSLDRLEPNFSSLSNASSAVGAVNLVSDRGGILRRVPLFVRFRDNIYPTFAMAMMVLEAEVVDITFSAEDSQLDLLSSDGATISIPVDASGQMLVMFYGPFQTFRYVSFYSLLHEMYPVHEQTNILEFFNGKSIIVGASAPGLFDLRATPRQPSFPGVEVHANILHQLRNGDFITELSAGRKIQIAVGLSILAGLIFAFTSPFAGIMSALFISLGYIIACWTGFAESLIWIPIIAPIQSVIATFTVQYVYRYQAEEKNKREMRRLFSHYVSSEVVNEILRNPSALKLGGEKKECTVFFSDLAGFTSISEAHQPEDLVKLLNEYLNEMTHIILDHGGTLDKYEGDAIMAIFGAPLDIGNHAAAACQTAIKMQARLEEIRQRWAPLNLPALYQRIGINSGPMIVGNMGSNIRFDYTAIGDAVNLGARLEGANKAYGTEILISESTYTLVKDLIRGRELDMIRVRGKSETLRIYEVMANQAGASEDKTKLLLEWYHQGYQQYQAKNWSWAAKQFEQALEAVPEDSPSRIMLARCREYELHPPAPDWDGVHVLKEK